MSWAVLEKLAEHAPKSVMSTSSYHGDEVALVDPRAIRGLAKWLKTTELLGFDMLTDLTAVDYLGRTPRFEVIYQLYSMQYKHRLRLKAGVPEEKPVIDTVSDIWRNANWLEREVWDLYGIHFDKHPDMRRILLYESFSGHPLRKDYIKQQRQPLVRRPPEEIEQAMGERRRGKSHLL